MPYLDFRGKEFVRNHHLSVPHRPLEPDTKKSVGKSRLDGNLIIHGDNLHALKSLIPMYAGQVNCIYIDPPYNTGNEGWCYNDNVNSPQQQAWLSQNPVGIEDGLRHDKWCAMMWPRLVLLHELLAEDGVIFISIDDNEQHHLRMMMDEIFGADNFRNCFAVSRVKKNIRERQEVRTLNLGYNFVLFYTKSDSALVMPPMKRQVKPARWHAFDAPGIRRTMEYDLFGTTPPEGRHWMYSQVKAKGLIERGELRLNPETKKPEYLLGASDETMLDTNWTDIQEYDSKWGLPNGEKNVNLLKRLIGMINKPNSVILDSFAGSGTTAHATFALNKEDGGSRKFILVECEDYADKITAERIRRVIKGVPNAKDKDLKAGLGGEFTYCELGEATDIEKLLSGKALPSFKVLGTLLFHTATDEVIDVSQIDTKTGYLGESSRYHLWLIYKPNLKYLKSNKAALTLDKAEEIAKAKGGDKRHLVFAPAVFVSRKVLDDMNIPVDYQPLPWGLYKVSQS